MKSQKIADGLYLTSFTAFLLWVYCIFTPVKDLPIIVQQCSDRYWLLIVVGDITFFAGMFFVGKTKESISSIEGRARDGDRFFVFFTGVIQVIIAVVILSLDVIFYPTRGIFSTIAILVVLLLINGLKYLGVSLQY